MTARDLAILLIRLLALSIFITLLGAIPNLIDFYQNKSLLLSIEHLIIPAIIVMILWFFADTIADKMTSGVDNSEQSGPFALSEIQTLAISLIGLYVLTQAIPNIVQLFVVYLNRKEEQLTPFRYNVFGFISPFIRIIIGFLLLLGSSGISGFINKSREAGLPKIDR